MEDAVVTPRKRTGWPKGKPRGPRKEDVNAAADRAELRAVQPKAISKMKSRPNWEGEDFVGVGQDGVDRLHIPEDIVNSLYGDGIALQWVTRSIRGMETPQELSKMTRGGWTPVHQSDFDGLLDGMFMPKGHDDIITVDDCLLVARPAEIHTKAKMLEKRAARRPLEISEEQLGRGIPNVSGSDHKSVQNSIKKTMERIEIPD